MSRCTLLLLLTISAGCLALHAQTPKCGADPASTIATDRPQITNSSIVVPCGSLQFENGFQETTANAQHGYDLPETSIRLGFARKTELRLAVPDYFINAETTSTFANGFSDLVLGVKQQLGPTPKRFGSIDLSIIPSLSLPSGSNAISSHGYDPSVQLPWSRSLSKNWTAAGQLSLFDPTQLARHNLTGQPSLYFDRQLTAPMDTYIEYSGDFPQRGGPEHIVDFGTAYKPSPHQQLDLHCGFGLSSAAPSFMIGFGYSVRFQAFRSK